MTTNKKCAPQDCHPTERGAKTGKALQLQHSTEGAARQGLVCPVCGRTTKEQKHWTHCRKAGGPVCDIHCADCDHQIFDASVPHCTYRPPHKVMVNTCEICGKREVETLILMTCPMTGRRQCPGHCHACRFYTTGRIRCAYTLIKQ